MIGEKAFAGISALLDWIDAREGSLTEQQRIDVAARVRSLKDRVEKMDAGFREKLIPAFDGEVFMRGTMFTVERIVSVRETLDTKRLREEQPDVFVDYSRQNNVTSLKFKGA